jgi:hypothetical protein
VSMPTLQSNYDNGIANTSQFDNPFLDFEGTSSKGRRFYPVMPGAIRSRTNTL